jgi:serine/threonine protein kinase/Tol biopolymer transport system component
MNGKTLGHYRVGEQLGRGGMGEVYVADDLNLNRKVALKFLPDAFTGDPERMARFEREAKLLASLNHPNIAAIYGLEQAEGKRFIVMELVEGETLAQRLGKGALPIDDALAVCRQIAEGLEAAHEKGVIHRDLKPANVMITEGEKVKILDFGLAKALSEEAQSVDSSHSPTLTEAMTRPGVILGTAAYMSPEQAKGKAADKRADIWAFGCILYECLAGKRAFEGETVTETLAAILKAEPDWSALPATIPPNIRIVLRRCLEKDTGRRFRDVADVRIEIEEEREIDEAAAPMKHSRLALIWAAIATLLVMALAIPTFRYFRNLGTPEAMLFQIPVPPMPDYSILISPDGRVIAYVAPVGGTNCLFVREIGSATPKKINGTEGADHPFWSPDSRSIAFFSGGRLKRVDVSGGSPRDICATSSMAGGTWNSKGVIVYSDWPILRRVSADGGDPSPITELSKDEVGHGFPFFLPDGQHYLYTAFCGTASKNTIYAGSLDPGERVRILAANSIAVYAEPGYLLFQAGRALFGQSFDAEKLKLTGEAVRIAENLASHTSAGGLAFFGASRNGALIYRTTGVQDESRFEWVDRSGKTLEFVGEPGRYEQDFDLSPDGKQIAVVVSNPGTNSDLWLMECERNALVRLTFTAESESDVIWSPDGLRIAFSSSGKGNGDIFAKEVTGIGKEMLLIDSATPEYSEDWSKDGRYIAYASGVGDADIYALPLFGDRKPLTVALSPLSQDEPHFSNDGKWIAYDSDESETWQIYVVSFPDAGQKRQISTHGGAQPRWRRDGKELYYLGLEGKMMAVDIRTGARIEPGIPRSLFDTQLTIDPTLDQYDVTSDGQRFLILKPLSDSVSTTITIVLNWTALLKQ